MGKRSVVAIVVTLAVAVLTAVGGPGPVSALEPAERLPDLGMAPLTDLRIERSIGLKVVKLTGCEIGNKDAPNVSPAIRIAVKVDHFGRFEVVHRVIQQNTHRCCRPAEHHELHSSVVEDRAVGKCLRKL